MYKQITTLLILFFALLSCKYSQQNRNISCIEILSFEPENFYLDTIIEDNFYTYKFILKDKQVLIKTPIFKHYAFEDLATYTPIEILILDSGLVAIRFQVPSMGENTIEIKVDFDKELISETKHYSSSFNDLEIHYDTINHSIKKAYTLNSRFKNSHFKVIRDFKFQNNFVGASTYPKNGNNQIILIDSISYDIKERYFLNKNIKYMMNDGGPTLILKNTNSDSIIRVENFIDKILVNGEFIKN